MFLTLVYFQALVRLTDYLPCKYYITITYMGFTKNLIGYIINNCTLFFHTMFIARHVWNLSYLNIINWLPTFNYECLNMILLKCFFCLKPQIKIIQCIWIEITNFNFLLGFILHLLALFIYPKGLRGIHLASPCPFHIS